MKTISRSLLVLFCACALSATAHPITLNAGETFTHQFSTLPFLQIQTYYEGTARPEGNLFWSAISLSRGTQLEVKLFEGSVSDEPLIEHIWSSSTSTGLLGGGFTLYPPTFQNVWQDLQGAFSMAVLFGSASINNIEISSFIPIDSTHANFYHRNLSVIPEPRSLALFIIAAMGLLLSQTIRKSGPNHALR